GGSARARRRRHGQRLHPRHPGAVGDTRCSAWPRARCRGRLHRRLERARHVRGRQRRCPAWSGSGRAVRRQLDSHGHAGVGPILSGVATGGSVRDGGVDMTAGSTAKAEGAFLAFSHRDFAAYWVGSLFGNLGFQMQSAALFWQVSDLRGRPLDLAFIGLAEFAPALLLLAIIGPTADRVERRLIVQCGYAVQLVGALLLVVFTLAKPSEAWPFFIVAFLFGSVRAFSQPAGRAMVATLVPTEHLANGVAWRSTGFQMAIIGGPALAGVIYLIGPVGGYAPRPLRIAPSVGAPRLMTRRPPPRLPERP